MRQKRDRERSSTWAIGFACVSGVFWSGACGSDEPVDPVDDGNIAFRYSSTDEDFFRQPWPSNDRVLDDGTVDLSDFPEIDIPFLDSVRQAIEGDVTGFSTMPVGYFAMDRTPGAAALLSPEQTLAADAAVQLVALGDGHCGERVPVEMQISEEEQKYLPENVLEISPVYGFVLHQGVDYAFIVQRNFGEPAGISSKRPSEFDAALAGDDPVLEPLRACASEGEISLDDIAVATVFTVQNILEQGSALRNAVLSNDADAPLITDWELDAQYTSAARNAYTATYRTPIFQTGESPYNFDGNILFEDGIPQIQRYEEVPMLLLTPPGNGPFPVLMWVDGTYWGQWSHVTSSLTNDLLTAGFAVASYMPQFHGERATDGSSEDASTYNFTNPTSGRNVLRQQLADAVYFTRVLREEVPNHVTSLDPSTIVFGGQSQGAQNGAFLAAVEPTVDAYVLNGLAGYLTLTVLERKDMLDYEAVLKALLNIQGEVDRFHPVLQLLQLGADAVDPENYAPGWRGSEANPSGAHVFVLNGEQDDTTVPLGISAVTIAGDLAPISPAGFDIDPFGVWDRPEESLPIAGNREAMDGSAVTLATYLSAESGHFTIYDEPAERARAVAFLVDSLTGVPSID